MLKFVSYSILPILIISLFSCSKYDEGPGLSFRSKKRRVANEWVVETYLENGIQTTTDYQGDELTWEFEKGGEFDITLKNDDEISGTWEFNEKKDNIITYGEENTVVYNIIKLKEKEMWLSTNFLNHIDPQADLYEFHLIPFADKEVN